jgi:hypothetical protein
MLKMPPNQQIRRPALLPNSARRPKSPQEQSIPSLGRRHFCCRLSSMARSARPYPFYKLKRAVKKLPDESVDTLCGYVKGKNASGGDTGEMAFLYIIRNDRDGEAYLVDGKNYTAQTVHSVLCD